MPKADLPLPLTGGRWSRDPETGALTPLSDDAAAALPADALEAPEPAPETPAEADAPADKRKGKA